MFVWQRGWRRLYHRFFSISRLADRSVEDVERPRRRWRRLRSLEWLTNGVAVAKLAHFRLANSA